MTEVADHSVWVVCQPEAKEGLREFCTKVDRDQYHCTNILLYTAPKSALVFDPEMADLSLCHPRHMKVAHTSEGVNTAGSEKGPAKFGEQSSVMADGLCIGCPG